MCETLNICMYLYAITFQMKRDILKGEILNELLSNSKTNNTCVVRRLVTEISSKRNVIVENIARRN